MNQFENISNETLMRDYQELWDLEIEAKNAGKPEDADEHWEYRQTVEQVLNSRGLYLNNDGVWTTDYKPDTGSGFVGGYSEFD